eukprot:6474182-Amphidinium_carterae.1
MDAAWMLVSFDIVLTMLLQSSMSFSIVFGGLLAVPESRRCTGRTSRLQPLLGATCFPTIDLCLRARKLHTLALPPQAAIKVPSSEELVHKFVVCSRLFNSKVTLS